MTCFLPVVESEIEISTLEIVPSKSTVQLDEVFNITVRFINKNETIDNWKLNISYNPELVTYVSSKIINNWTGLGCYEVVQHSGFVFAQGFSKVPIYTDSIFLNITFRAIKGGKTYFNFSQLLPETMWCKVGFGGPSINTLNLKNCTVFINAPYVPPVDDDDDTNNTNQTNGTTPPVNDTNGTIPPVNNTNQTQPPQNNTDNNQTLPPDQNQTNDIIKTNDEISITTIAIIVIIFFIVAVVVLWLFFKQ
jgi:hypothetical protein